MVENEKTTLELIHDAAKAEFMEKGFREASLRNIAKSAGVTTGALYGYYGSKEELFKSLVSEVYRFIVDTYTAALYEFESLPMEEQPDNIAKASSRCMYEILDYSYDHREECYMLLQCAEGTRYAFLIDEMAELEVEATHKYYDVLEKLGKPAPMIDRRLEHILVTGMMNAYFEIIIHDTPKDYAERYLKELNDFYTAGWMKIMGQ